MSQLSYSYFTFWGRGLGPLLALEEHNADYVGRPVDIGQEWPKLKEQGFAPFGNLPVLKLGDGTTIGQHDAILNYVGDLRDAQGGCNGEKAVSAQLLGVTGDVWGDLLKTQPMVVAPEVKDKEAFAKLWAEGLPKRFSYLEKFAKYPDKFTTSGRTVGELGLFAVLHQINFVKPGFLSGYPKVHAFYNRVLGLPGVQRVLNGQTSYGKMGNLFVAGQ